MNTQNLSTAKKIGRNEPCLCGSGKKYKKCCLGTEKDPSRIVKCAICEKNFDRNLIGAFQSIEREGKRIYFCPDCNTDLACSVCNNKLGSKSFDLFSCECCGGVEVVCEGCIERGAIPSDHH